MAAIPRVSLTSLQSPLATEEWQQAVESLYLSICRHNTCIVALGPEVAQGSSMVLQQYLKLFHQSPVQHRDRSTPSPVPGWTPQQSSVSVRLGRINQLPVTDSLQKLTEMSFACWEVVATTVLGALCRSCHVRLRSDTFRRLLDDTPLPQGSVSSSELLISQPNKGMRSPLREQSWNLDQQQEGTRPPGLISLVFAQLGPSLAPKLQVKDGDGNWADVSLAGNELAILVGQTAERATAGVFKAATSRVMGALLAGPDKGIMEFQLHARPDAVIDLQGIISSAGHAIPAGYTSPISMHSLMSRLDAVMTPQQHVPDNKKMQGSLEISALRSVSSRHATAGKRMSMGPPSPTDIRRSKSHRLSDEGPSRAALHVSSPDGSTDAMHVDTNDRLCITVDGAGKRKSSFIRLGIEMAGTGNAVLFEMHPTGQFRRLFEVYCQIVTGIDVSHVTFMYKGARIHGLSTPRALGVHSGEVIQVGSPDLSKPLGVEEGVLQGAGRQNAKHAAVKLER